MAYKRKIYTFKNAIEIEEYHTGKYGAPGQSRVKRKKATPEMMERVNQYNKEKKARRKLRANFDVNDYFICLTYKKEFRPEDMKMAKKHLSKFLRKIRNFFKKNGCELKYLRNIEVGTKNGWHIHLIINRIPGLDMELVKAWEHGKVVLQLLHDKGEFKKLAAYITKTPNTDPRLRESHYWSSKNLPIPEAKEKIIKWKSWREIKEKEGYYVDEESFHEGINPVTGYKYRIYTLLRVRRE